MTAPDDLVELASFPDEPSAGALVARLADEGIPAATFGGHIKNANLYFALTLSIKVMVRREDLDRARALLDDGPLPEGWEDEAERMPTEDEEDGDAR